MLNNNSKKWLVFVGGLVVLSVVVYAGFLLISEPVESKYAKVEIDSQGHKRVFEGEVIDGMTVFQALQAATLAGNLSFAYTLDPESNKLIVKSINGYTADDVKKSPEFYLNSNPIDSGIIHTVPIKPGDSVLIVLE